MYIKLTRMDGDPIWINAAFVVTIEPHKRSGGSIVVPIGDGLDYEVKESPETVLAMLDGAPAPTVVPVPTSDALSTTPEDVSPSDDFDTAEEKASPAEDAKPAKKTAKSAKAKTVKNEDGLNDQTQAAAPKKKTASKSRTKKKAPLALSENELDRLRKLAPKSLKKLHNTISTQFKTLNAEEAIESLKEHDIITLDGDHVIWADPA